MPHFPPEAWLLGIVVAVIAGVVLWMSKNPGGPVR
jgi:hypothetical protein